MTARAPKGISPILTPAPQQPAINLPRAATIPVPGEDQRAHFAQGVTFGSNLGRAVAMSLDDTIMADSIIVASNDTANSVRLSDGIEERISFYAVRTVELAKGNFDFRVNFRFENPRSDLVSAAEGVLSIQAYRDRLCGLELELRQAKKKIEAAYDMGVAYLFEAYPQKMDSLNKDTFLRNLFISKVFKPLEETKKEIRALLEQIKSALDNLDKAHFAYKEVVEVGKVILNRVEGRVG